MKVNKMSKRLSLNISTPEMNSTKSERIVENYDLAGPTLTVVVPNGKLPRIIII